jgi:tetratricopeptide (TPR) repeat protein
MDALLAELVRSQRSRAVPLLWLGAVAFTGAAAWAFASTRTGDPCAAIPQRLAGVWDDERRAALAEVTISAGLREIGDSTDATTTALDAFADAYVAEARAACVARRDGAQTQEVHDLRMACSSRSLLEARALVDALLVADVESMARGASAVAELPDPAECADVTRLLPDSQRGGDEAARADLARARAAIRLGRFSDAADDAQRVLAGDDQPAPIRAEASLLRGWALSSGGDLHGAREALSQAVREALAAGADGVFAEAARELIRIEATQAGRPDVARTWFELGMAATTRAGLGGGFAATLHEAMGRAHLFASRIDQAIAEADLAIELAASAHGIDGYGALRPRVLRANLELFREDPDSALVRLRELLPLSRRLLGDHHPDTLHIRSDIVSALVERGDDEDALAEIDPLVALHESLFGPDHINMLPVLGNRVRIYERTGRLDEAIRDTERAIAIADRAGIRTKKGAFLATLIDLHLAKKEPQRAVELGREGLALVIEMVGPVHPFTGGTLRQLAEAQLAAGDAEAAAATIDRALAIYPQLRADNRGLWVQVLRVASDIARARGRPDDALRHELEALAQLRGYDRAEAHTIAKQATRVALALAASTSHHR